MDTAQTAELSPPPPAPARDQLLQAAVEAERAGRPDEAERALREAVAQGDADDLATRRLAELLERCRRLDEALPLRRALAERAPHDAEAVRAEAELLWQLGRFAEAAEGCARARAIDPDNLAAAILQARLLLRQADHAGAAAICTAMVRRWPDQIVGHRVLVQALLGAGDLASAEAAAAHATERWPDDAGLATDRAIAAVRRSRWADAAALARPVTERWPAQLWGWRALMQGLLGTGDLAGAEAAATQAVERFADDAGVASDRARIAARREDWPEAAARARRLVERWPEYIWCWRPLLQALIGAGALDEAEAVAARAMERFPADAGLAVDQARVAVRRADWPQALARGRAVVERWPGEPWTWRVLLEALFGAGDLAEAEAVAGTAVQRFPADAGVAGDHARAALLREDWPEAIARAGYVTERWPDLAWCWRGLLQAQIGVGDLAAAESTAAAAVARCPEDPALAADQARLSALREDWREAAARGRRLVERWPDRLEAWRGLPLALLAVGEAAEAEAVAAEAIARWPLDVNLGGEHARLAVAREDWPEAVARARALAGRAPELAWCRRLLLQTLLGAGVLDEAETVAAAALARWPDDAAVAGDHARVAVLREDWPEAVARARRMRERWPDRPEVWRTLVQALLSAGEAREAEAVAAAAIARWPEDVGLGSDHARLALTREDWAEGLARARALAGRWPDVAGSHRLLLQALLGAGALDEAEAVGAAALERWPDDAGIAADHARAAFVREDWARAVARGRAVAARWPDVAWCRRTLLQALLGAAMLDEAEAVAAAALERWSDDAGMAADHARVAALREDWPEAVARARRLSERWPDQPSSRRALVQVLLSAGDAVEAERVAGEALERWPDDVALAADHARAALLREDWPQALARAKAVVARWPEQPAGWRTLVAALFDSGDWAAAEAAAARAMERWPHDVLFACEHARLALRRDDWAEALARARRAVARWPHNVHCWRVLAEASSGILDHPHGLLLRPDEAEALVQEQPDSPHAWSSLVRTLTAFGWIERAGEACREARRRWPDDATIEAEAQRLAAMTYALDVLRKARALFPQDQHLGLAHARLLLRLRIRHGALDEADRLLALHPAMAQLSVLRAELLSALGRPAEAVAALARVVPRTAPEMGELVGRVSFEIARRGGHRAVLDIIERVGRFGGVCAMPTRVAEHHYRMGFFDEAERAYASVPEAERRNNLHFNTLSFHVYRTVPALAGGLDLAAMRALPRHVPMQFAWFLLFIDDMTTAWRLLAALRDKFGPGSVAYSLYVLHAAFTLRKPSRLREPALRLAAVMRQDCRALIAMAWFLDLQHLPRRLLGRDAVARIRGEIDDVVRANLASYAWLRRGVRALRTRLAGAGAGDVSAMRASYLCAIHRPEDVDNLLTQLQRQAHDNAEALFCINKTDVALVRGLLEAAIPRLGFTKAYRFVDCGDGKLGHALNEGARAATGDVMFKIDADDIYAPAFTAKLLQYQKSAGAEVVVQQGRFAYVEDTGDFLLTETDVDQRYGGLYSGELCHGSVIAFTRPLFERIGFDPRLPEAEDVSFIRRCQGLGARIILADPFDHIYMRRDKRKHTFGIPNLLFPQAPDLYLGRRATRALATADAMLDPA